MLTGIKYLLDVSDMDRAVAFYVGAFGLEVAVQAPGWSELRFGEATVALHGGRVGSDAARTGLSFTVDDIAAAVEAVEAHGGTVLHVPFAPGKEGILLAEFADPDQNCFMASQAL